MILLCICAVFSSLQLYKRAFRYVGIKMMISVLVTLYISGLFFYFLYISRKIVKTMTMNIHNARLFFDKYIGVFMIFFLLFIVLNLIEKLPKLLIPMKLLRKKMKCND